MKTTFQYDHYYLYNEIKSNLEYFAEKYPQLVKLEVNAVTAEGKNQYAVTLTNTSTGDALTKPGLYIDGNIHAGEVTASMAAMHTIDYLVTNYGTDDLCTKILDTKTIYVIPRVSPDGAETYLTTPYNLRSLNQDYLPEKGGVKPEDLDGDGVARMMKIPTPYGAWKEDSKNPGQMTMRTPSDFEGAFYDIYPEGILEEYDGQENLKTKKPSWGLDMNRNFPLGWFPDSRQPGAGKYPLSATETKAVVDFALSHPNIGGAAIGHTSGGLVLIPPGTKASKDAPQDDMKAMWAIADMGKEELGYLPLHIFDSFMKDQTHYDSGALDDWFYQSQGVPAYTMEFWDVCTKAGVPYTWGEEKEPIEKSIERFYAIVKWVKENAPQYFLDWQKYNHPVFGEVELGGLNTKFTLQNPPEQFLLTECEHDTKFNLRFACTLPSLTFDSVSAAKVGTDLYQIDAVVGNKGYLPTNLTDEAVNLKVDHPVVVKINGAALISGKQETEVGNLSGYSRTMTGSIYGNFTTYQNAEAKKKLTWIVNAPAGTEVTINAVHEKAGNAQIKVTLS